MVAKDSFEPLRIGYMEIADHLAVKALDQGLPEKEKLQFETLPVRSFWRMGEALQDREMQGALLPLPTALELFCKGLDIGLIGFVNQEGGTLLFNSRAGVGDIKGCKGCKGRSLLVPSRLSVEAMLLHRLLTKTGLQVGKGYGEDSGTRLVEIAPHLMLEVVQQDKDGDIAGFLMPEPYAGLAVKEGSGNVFLQTGSLWSGHPSSVLVFHRSVLEEYPDAVKSFTSGLEEAGRWIARTSETEFADFTYTVFGTRLGPDSPVTQKREELFGSGIYPPKPDTIQVIMTYMSGRMGITTDCSGKADDIVQTGWLSEPKTRDLKS